MGMKERQSQRAIEYVGQASVYERKTRGLAVSEAHSASHLQNVADLSVFVGDIFNFSPQEKQLAYASGWLHDAVRSPSEDPSTRDEQASAQAAKRSLQELSIKGEFVTNEVERDAVGFAIEHHGSAPTWLQRSDIEQPRELQNKLWLALFIADKMEANGVRVIARRSSFVAGDRLRSPQGDWRTFGFIPDRDEGLVVAIESILRLAFINPESFYPTKLKPMIHPLYRAQREFVNGTLHSLRLSVDDISRLLLMTKNQDGKTILEARKIDAPADLEALTKFLMNKSGISNESIRAATNELADSSIETIRYFSVNYQSDLDTLVSNWNPQGKTARKWAKAISSYNKGEWLAKQKNKYHITKPFRALFHV